MGIRRRMIVYLQKRTKFWYAENLTGMEKLKIFLQRTWNSFFLGVAWMLFGANLAFSGFWVVCTISSSFLGFIFQGFPQMDDWSRTEVFPSHNSSAVMDNSELWAIGKVSLKAGVWGHKPKTQNPRLTKFAPALNIDERILNIPSRELEGDTSDVQAEPWLRHSRQISFFT